MKKKYQTRTESLAARADQARERRAKRKRVTGHVAASVPDVAVIGVTDDPLKLSADDIARLQNDKAALLAGLLDRGTPTVAPSIEELVAAVPVAPPDEVAAALAAEKSAADVVAQITFELAQLDIARRQAAHDAAQAGDAILLGPLSQDNQQRAALVHASAQVADAGFEVTRLELQARLGPAETALAVARAATEPVRQAQAVRALVISRKVADEAEAQREADSVGSRLQSIAALADPVLAEVALARRMLTQFEKTALPQLAVYEAARNGLDATAGLELRFARSIQEIRQTYNLMRRAIAEDSDTLAQVKARVTRTGGRWRQEDQDETVLAVRRLKTITRDAVADLQRRVTGLATTAMLLADADFDAAASGRPVGIPKPHQSGDEWEIERAARKDEVLTLEYRAAESEARALQTRHDAIRSREGVKTAQFNDLNRREDDAREARVTAARLEVEQQNRTALVRAIIQGG